MTKKGTCTNYRKDLDAQMVRVYEKRHETLQERERDRKEMQQEQVKVDKEIAAEKAEADRKVKVMQEAQKRAKQDREAQARREAERRQRERDHLLMQVCARSHRASPLQIC